MMRSLAILYEHTSKVNPTSIEVKSAISNKTVELPSIHKAKIIDELPKKEITRVA